MKEINLGPSASALALSIKFRREDLNLTFVGLSNILEKNGHRIAPLGLRRIEAKARRVDVDDLVALCYALNASPPEMLAGIINSPATGVPEGLFTGTEITAWLTGGVMALNRDELLEYWDAELIKARNRLEGTEKLAANDSDNPGRTEKWEARIQKRLSEIAAAQDRLAFWELESE